MSKIDEILKRKNEEIENRKNQTIKTEINRHADEKIKQKEFEEELKRKDIEKERLKELESIETNKRRKEAILNVIGNNVLSYGFIGLLIGAVIGFGKGCVRYNYVPPSIDGGDSFFVPFRYIIPNALIICFIGVIIGVLVGIFKGQNE